MLLAPRASLPYNKYSAASFLLGNPSGMSYRSFKRVLGETYLELKLLVLFAICLFVLTVVSFWIYGSLTEKLVYQQNRTKGWLLVDGILKEIHWREFENRSPSLVDALRQELKNHPERYQWYTIRPQTVEGKGRPQDEYDYEILQRFPPVVYPLPEQVEYAERLVPETQEYHYYQAIRAKRGCVDCHRALSGQNDLTEGELIAVVKVKISDAPVRRAILWNRVWLFTAAIVTAFCLVLVSYLIIRYVIVKPLKHLQEVSDAISRGDLDKRAEIHTGDEFEALGTAFNRMVRHLVAVQEELRRLNVSLDAKVDELAEKNMQLYEMNRLKSDFLAMVSHELRTPLNSIIGFSDVLLSMPKLDARQRRYVQNIQRSGRSLLEMINDILDLAKIEAGRMEIRPEHFRIHHLVGSQCDMARPLAEKKNIDLEVRIDPELPELYQDAGKIQQILSNLLSNAIKFTPEGGRVVVEARRTDDGMLELVVSDTGIGIPEEEQTHIFDKFRQGSAVSTAGDAMTREYSGTGLGLSIVKEMCRLLGGRVSVQSELGKGSTFTVVLPWELPEHLHQHDVDHVSMVYAQHRTLLYRGERASSPGQQESGEKEPDAQEPLSQSASPEQTAE